jgi:nicotinamide-nucleotide amidase
MNDPLVHSLAAELGSLLAGRRWRVTTCESCTGGLVAAAITAIPGSSGWFDEGYVTYANAAKTRLVGVPAVVIEREGAVSEATARAMAEGARRASGADVSVAVTGVAGPGGGTAAKPVGLVWIAWAGADGTRAETMRFDGDRDAVRRAAVVAALEGLIERVRAG